MLINDIGNSAKVCLRHGNRKTVYNESFPQSAMLYKLMPLHLPFKLSAGRQFCAPQPASPQSRKLLLACASTNMPILLHRLLHSLQLWRYTDASAQRHTKCA